MRELSSERLQEMRSTLKSSASTQHFLPDSWRWSFLIFDTGAVELYDLDRDPAETVDLSLSHPDLVRLLQQEMERWRGQVGARLPSRPSGPRTSTERPDAPRPEGTP